MKQPQSAHKRAEDLLLGRPLPILAPHDPRNSDWLAQPYFGPVVETYITDDEEGLDSSDSLDLEEVMFRGLQDCRQLANKAVKGLTQYKDRHDRHYSIKECQEMGLRIEPLEADQTLQDWCCPSITATCSP